MEQEYRLTISLNVLDHLGRKLYSNVPAVLSELVANAWDADATCVYIDIQDDRIAIRDNGLGMNQDEINARYLVVGGDRRETLPGKTPMGRDPMGRKGLGKLAAFAIVNKIEIHSKKIDSEGKALCLKASEIDELTRGNPSVTSEYHPKALVFSSFDFKSGTCIILEDFIKKIDRKPAYLKKRLARRFSIIGSESFKVYINDEEVTRKDRDYYDLLEYMWYFGDTSERYKSECRNLAYTFKLNDVVDESKDYKVTGWIGTIKEHRTNSEDDNKIVLYSRGKLVHEDILKDYVEGGIYASYLIGDIDVDFIDMDDQPDIITSNRQAITETDERFEILRVFIGKAIKEVQNKWTRLRNESKEQQIDTRIGPFSTRIEKFREPEIRSIKTALRNLAKIPSLNDEQFQSMGNAMLTAFEDGNLKALVQDIAKMEESNEEELLKILAETQVMTAIHVGEAVKTKIDAIGGLKVRINGRELENAVRDYIAKNPWLIAPEWETFRVENSLRTILSNIDPRYDLSGDDWDGRVDLLLRSGRQLLLLEFMRPGLRIDKDHIERTEWYVGALRNYIATNTGNEYDNLDAYLVADRVSEDTIIKDRILQIKEKRIYIMDWSTLLRNAIWNWREFLKALIQRDPNDFRMQALEEYIKDS